MRRPCFTSLVLSLFCHMLTKGERGKIEMFLLCRRLFVMVVVVVVDIVSCESRVFFELSFLS